MQQPTQRNGKILFTLMDSDTILEVQNLSDEDIWIIDSGASQYVTGARGILEHFEDEKKRFRTRAFGNTLKELF